MKCTHCGLAESIDCQVYPRDGSPRPRCARCGGLATQEQVEEMNSPRKQQEKHYSISNDQWR